MSVDINDGWSDVIDYVQDGEAASAANTNRPTAELASRTDLLLRWLEKAAAGSALYLRNVPLNTGVTAGMPVFFNDTTGAFEPAFSTDTDAANSWGICTNTGSTGDVLISGVWYGADISAVADEVVTGYYYLGDTEGTLTSVQKPYRPRVLFYSAEQKMAIVYPQLARGEYDHMHYRFDLAMVESTSDTVSGWAAASEFDDAPASAVYGYRIVAGSALSDAFPPYPLASCLIDLHGETFYAYSPYALITIDENGIWWMNSDVSPLSSLSPAGAVTLWFTGLTGSLSAVNSLTVADGSPLVIVDRAGNSASKGDLKIGVDLSVTQATESIHTPDGLVVKSMAGTTASRGYVVGSLASDDDRIEIDATQGTESNPAGALTIRLKNIAGTDSVVEADTINYFNADAATLRGFLYHSLAPSKTSKLTVLFHIPLVFSDGSTSKEATLRGSLVATRAGTLPELTVSAKRLGLITTRATMTGTDLTISSSVAQSAVTAESYADTQLASAITVLPGDVVAITIARASDDTYTGSVGFMRFYLALE